MFRELNEGLAYLTAIDFNDPGLRDHGAFRCPGAHAIFSVCMRVCVRVRHRQRRVCTDLIAMAGTPLRSVSMQAVCVCVCVCLMHMLVWV